MSLYSRVNGRGHRTLSDKAKCTECKREYNAWKFIGRDGRCYQCHGVNLNDEQGLIKFIQENRG